MIYLDNQSTTRVDPRVIAAMLPTFDLAYANPGSITHEAGIEAAEIVRASTETVAAAIGATPREIVFTSGATESNCLAIFGYCLRRQPNGESLVSSRRHVVTVATEHKAILDPCSRLQRMGFDVTYLEVQKTGSSQPGLIDLNQFADALRDDTMFVTIMLANNEIGVIQPLAEIAKICHHREIVLHTDATQAIGQIPVNVNQLGVDLLSFSAHKFYGPKGIGGLFVRQTDRRIRLSPQIEGGGQQLGRRSGTLNVTGIVGMATAIELAIEDLSTTEVNRKRELRARLYQRLVEGLGKLPINGGIDFGANSQALTSIESSIRLPGNLNVQFPGFEGQTLMLGAPNVAVSSGSACTAASPEPSHVLRSLGLTDEQVRSSLRFGIGRFNTNEEIDQAADQLIESARQSQR